MFVLITQHSCSLPNYAFDLFSGFFLTINHAKINASQTSVDCIALLQLLESYLYIIILLYELSDQLVCLFTIKKRKKVKLTFTGETKLLSTNKIYIFFFLQAKWVVRFACMHLGLFFFRDNWLFLQVLFVVYCLCGLLTRESCGLQCLLHFTKRSQHRQVLFVTTSLQNEKLPWTQIAEQPLGVLMGRAWWISIRRSFLFQEIDFNWMNSIWWPAKGNQPWLLIFCFSVKVTSFIIQVHRAVELASHCAVLWYRE